MVTRNSKATRKPHNPYKVGQKTRLSRGDFLGTSPRTWDLVIYGFRRKTIRFPHTLGPHIFRDSNSHGSGMGPMVAGSYKGPHVLEVFCPSNLPFFLVQSSALEAPSIDCGDLFAPQKKKSEDKKLRRYKKVGFRNIWKSPDFFQVKHTDSI